MTMASKFPQPKPRKKTATSMSPAEINAMFQAFALRDEAPKTELIAPNPFCLLVAVVLSAQATDAGVNRATPALFNAASTPQQMVKLGEARIRELVKSINFNNSKAKNVFGLSRMLVEAFDGAIPIDRELLQRLPGVGRKTANVWLNCVHGHATIAVDTHVFRVVNRLGLVKAKNVETCEAQLEKRVPDQWKTHAHHWLILHGRYICKARQPECWHCPVIDYCGYPDKALVPPMKKAK